jgi:hypothetical protein
MHNSSNESRTHRYSGHFPGSAPRPRRPRALRDEPPTFGAWIDTFRRDARAPRRTARYIDAVLHGGTTADALPNGIHILRNADARTSGGSYRPKAPTGRPSREINVRLTGPGITGIDDARRSQTTTPSRASRQACETWGWVQRGNTSRAGKSLILALAFFRWLSLHNPSSYICFRV